MKRFVLYISTVTFMILFFISCSNDEDKGNYLTGTVDYSGESDGGIVVNLYSYPEINDTLAQIRYDYPQIGVNCTDQKLRELLFDKNAQPAVASTTTNSKGKWELKNLESGEFVLVFSKNHAYKFIYNQKVGGGENNIGKVELTKAIELLNDTTITQDMIVPSGSNLYIEGVVTIDEFKKLTIEDGVNIVFADSTAELDKGGINVLADAEIEFLGKEDSWINVFGESDSLKNGWSRIKIGDSGKGKFRYSRISNGMNAVFYLKSMPDVENCIFLECETGLGFEMNRGGNLHDLLFKNCSIGISGRVIDSVVVCENVFYNNIIGLDFENNGVYILKNSFLSMNIKGLKTGNLTSGHIRHNNFEDNVIGIFLYGDDYGLGETKPQIFYNTFENNNKNDVLIGNDTKYTENVLPAINWNNFNNSNNINIEIDGEWWIPNAFDINCSDNWWTNETDSSKIEERIIDKDDHNNANYIGQIIFNPICKQKIEEAGIK